MTLEELENTALMHDIPIMQKEGLNFLIQLLKEKNCKHVLEIGSAIGYSSIMMASHIDDLYVETIELDEKRYLEAVENIKAFQLEDRIFIHHDDALTFDVEKRKIKDYDLLFIDAAKAQYQKFFEKYIPYIQGDGLTVVDNLDFHGMIFHIDDIKNRNTKQLVKKIKRFKDWIMNHEEFETEYYHIGDGIVVIKRRKHETVD